MSNFGNIPETRAHQKSVRQIEELAALLRGDSEAMIRGLTVGVKTIDGGVRKKEERRRKEKEAKKEEER